jgi:hypothetical protein
MNKEKMPLWVKLSGLGAIILIILFLVSHLTGHGFHHHHA